MEKENAAKEAAYNASKADPSATAEPAPSIDTSKPKPKPRIPTPATEDPVTPPDTTEPEVAVTDDTPPETGTAVPMPEETIEPAEPAKAVELPPAIVELETKAKSLVAALETDRDKELAANAKTYGWELDSWVKTLSKSDQITWRPHAERLKRLATNDRVPTRIDSDSGINVSERMSKIADFAARKQKSIDETFASKAAKIRDAYVTRVKEAAGKSLEAGDKEVAQALDSKAEAAADLDAWVAGLMGRKPAAAPAVETSIVGKWRSKTTSTVVTFVDDGTCKASHGDKGKWTKEMLESDQIRYVISWNSGYVDQLSPEEEGTILAGQNNHGELVRLVRKPDKQVE
jgi:hypothetical protein